MPWLYRINGEFININFTVESYIAIASLCNKALWVDKVGSQIQCLSIWVLIVPLWCQSLMTCTVTRNISVAVEVLNHGASAAYSCNATQIGVNWEHSKDHKLCSKWFPDLKWSS